MAGKLARLVSDFKFSALSAVHAVTASHRAQAEVDL
jgi:hypothetical protein